MPSRMSRPQWERLLGERRVGVLATMSEDGTPVLTPIWFLYRGGRILMRTGKEAVKARNIARNPKAAICVQDERPPYRSITVYGTAAIEPAAAGLDADIARRYLGSVAGAGYLRTSREAIEQSEEVTIALTPERVVSQDFARETPLYARLWLLAKRVLPPGL